MGEHGDDWLFANIENDVLYSNGGDDTLARRQRARYAI
ncbi:hypothetical protein IQ235_05885 [Oscillatoriales cyanobacterium LEGE 11467]|uniref:Uncharacterized protein n=1 Tax=Zarconia navalis LEGE 11467 TaxID=1828826 RepID=A0A928VX20_9CYAN|nr:hypothetical protein [Zarconia navalis LEGE 11467]